MAQFRNRTAQTRIAGFGLRQGVEVEPDGVLSVPDKPCACQVYEHDEAGEVVRDKKTGNPVTVAHELAHHYEISEHWEPILAPLSPADTTTKKGASK